MARVAKVVTVAVLLLAGTAFAAAFFGQRSLIFPVPDGQAPSSLPERVELIDLDIGRAYLALPLNQSAPAAPLLVFAHGNAELAHWSIESFNYFRELGIAVLLLEYPGYAGTAGKPSEESIVRSGLLAMDEVTARDDIDDQQIVMYGRSIGGGVAAQLATQREVAALVLESSFTSLNDIVRESGFPTFLLRDEFDNADAVARLDIPILLYHGSRDRIIPIAHSEKLAELANDATLLKANCGHNDCPRPWLQIAMLMR